MILYGLSVAMAGQKNYLTRINNSTILRLAPLLAQYLYLHKRLDLPGLGTFILDSSQVPEPETGRHGRTIPPEIISFETNTSIKESTDLIAFISAQTGKIKALAAADLDSHLELAHQFLNIGKPFALEGIGTIVKVRAGEFVFTPGTLIAELKKEQPAREPYSQVMTEDTPADYDYKNMFNPREGKARWKKPLVIFALVAGLVLAVWGGYTVYKRTSGEKVDTTGNKDPEKKTIGADTSVATNIKKDSTPVVSNPATTAPAGTFKFILETSDRERALTRYNKLKTYQWNVQLETSDSITYKIFMLLPGTARDTARLRDSLSLLTGRRVRIE